MEHLPAILAAYGLASNATLQPLGNGLINKTWLLQAQDQQLVLQQLNQHIFTHPQQIDDNIQLVATHLASTAPEYTIALPIATQQGATIWLHPESHAYFRIFPFINNSHTIDVVQNASEAYAAAHAFGKFTYLLRSADLQAMHTILPNFHHLPFRYQQLKTALQNGNRQRIHEAAPYLSFLAAESTLLQQFDYLIQQPQCPLRIMHHDTKINNVLFDATQKAIAVIDLDTLMPGYFFSDVGDMLRTYLPTVNEAHSNYSELFIRPEMLEAIIAGYSDAMGNELTPLERAHFTTAGKIMTYMQALRFITDYINNDVYYGAQYPKQNLVRAANQCVLLQQMNTLPKQHY